VAVQRFFRGWSYTVLLVLESWGSDWSLLTQVWLYFACNRWHENFFIIRQMVWRTARTRNAAKARSARRASSATPCRSRSTSSSGSSRRPWRPPSSNRWSSSLRTRAFRATFSGRGSTKGIYKFWSVLLFINVDSWWLKFNENNFFVCNAN